MQKLTISAGVLLLVVAVLAVPSRSQQDKSKRPSPPATAKCTFPDGKTITTDYSSPRMKGRKVEGGLEPWGKVWRAGANEATTFVTDADVTIDGKNVPAGSYTIFTVPNEKEWQLIVNKKTGEWGIPYTWQSDELFRAPMKVTSLPAPLEDFTISYANEGDACQLRMDWNVTRAYVNINEKK
ncbi:MAG TPA: DUF2911 domain-containing protein [Candidatus Acidoferrales bacterium]|nr:DUF2911 domain-containing protein [Candidatus Acidoferrales bacterium]